MRMEGSCCLAILMLWALAASGILAAPAGDPGQDSRRRGEEEQKKRIPMAVRVKFPQIIREDLCREAIAFCRNVYPETPEDWFRERLDRYVRNETWDVYHNAGTGAPSYVEMIFVKDGEKQPPVEVSLSFPDPHLRQTLTNSRLRILPGCRPNKVSMEQAEEQGQAMLARLVPDDKRRSALRIASRKHQEIMHYYDFLWRSTENTDHQDGDSLLLSIDDQTGVTLSCIMWSYSPENAEKGILARKDMEQRIQAQFKDFKPELLKLCEMRYVGHRYLCWAYYPPAVVPMGMWGINSWDAFTGDLIESNEVDAEGKQLKRRGFYRNPKYFPYDTEEKLVRRLEEVAQERAKELEAQQKKGEEAKGAGEDGGGQAAPGQ